MVFNFFIFLFICGIIIITYKYYKKLERENRYRNALYSRGFIKVYICFTDGDYKKGFITQAQYKSLTNLRYMKVKPVKMDGNEVSVKTDDIFYIEILETEGGR